MTSSNSDPALAPGRLWYAVAVAIFLLGMAGMGIFLISRLTGMGDGLVQIVVPGERELALTPGNYTIFHEIHSVIDGRIYDSTGIGGLEVTLTPPSGDPVRLTRPAMSGRYNLNGRTGIAAFDFTVSEAGNYTIAAHYADGDGPQTVLAVGKGFLGSLLGIIFGALGLAFGGAIIAAFIGVRTLIRRRRAGFAF